MDARIAVQIFDVFHMGVRLQHQGGLAGLFGHQGNFAALGKGVHVGQEPNRIADSRKGLYDKNFFNVHLALFCRTFILTL